MTKFRAGHQHAHSSVCARLGADKGIQVAFAGASKSRAVQKRGNSDSFFSHPSFIFFRKTLFLGGIVRKFQRAIEQTVQINILLNGLFRRRRLAGLQEIPPANFDRRDPHDLGDAIHVALHRKKALWSAESTKSSVRRSVCSHGLASNAHVRPAIRTASVNRATRKDHRRERRVSAAIDGELNLAAENFPVFANRSTMAGAGGMPLGRCGHVFHAVVDNFHGAAGFHCQQPSVPRDHGRVFFFSAKRSASLHLHDAHFFFGQREKSHQRLVHVVRALQGTPNGDAILRVECRDHTIVFNIALFLRASEILALDDVRRFFPNAIRVTFFHEKILKRIVGAPDDRRFVLTLFDGMNCGQRPILDGNGFNRFSQLVAIGMGQKQNGFLVVIHGFGGEARLVVQNKRNAVLSRNVFGGDNNVFVPVNARAKIDFFDFPARNGAAHGGTVKHAGQNHVVDVACRSRDFVPAFLAWNRSPDDVTDGHKLFAGDILYEMARVSNLYLELLCACGWWNSRPFGSPGNWPSLNMQFPHR